uniref:Nucleoporin NUP188 n=1 Tax=Anopheles farauti TaxID=69004 RepID=A0A182Q2U3_9DIPT
MCGAFNSFIRCYLVAGRERNCTKSSNKPVCVMEDVNGDIIQWRKLWQFVSGIHYGTPNADVKEKLLQVSKELVDGILHYKKPSKASEEKLQRLIKERNQLKLQPFANKLHQYLDIDAIQSWQILCFYLVNEYRGPATALAEYLSTETSMVKLLHDIWTYHTLERMVQLKVMKNLLEYFHSGSHPYSKEYREVVEKMGLPALRKSYLAQLKHLIVDPLSTHPQKTLPNDPLHGQTKLACAERRLRETNEILQILLLIVHYNGISAEELDQLFKLFREHAFGKQQEYLDPTSEIQCELVKRITYNELALVFRTLDLSDKFDDADWIERVVSALDGPMVSLHQFPEHGPLLLVWMLFNFRLQHTVEDEESTRRYQQLGSRAIKLGVFEYLHGIVSHAMFKDQSLVARIVRKSIFNQLGFLCQLFDAAESIAHHNSMYDLLSELLTSPTIATEFCKLEDHPVRALFNICLEHFPVEFTPLSKVAYALASAGASQNAYIQGLLENLPVYTELYTERARYEIRKAPGTNDDEFILCHDYTPSHKINFTVPRGTKLIVRDVHSQRTYVHFTSGYNYFNALHHEINELLEDAQTTSTLSTERVQRIASGLKYLAVAVRRIQQPHDITAEMVHPTEMVFDVMLKFKSLPNPPIELLVQCLNVCTALVPLFEQEIYTRIINLNILPSVNSANLTYQDYANGVGFDSSLIGYYLVNVERNAGRYPILMAYFNFLKTYTKLGRDNVFGVELPGVLFLLREVLPVANNWRYETATDRYRVLVFVVQYIHEMLQVKGGGDRARRLLRDVCVYSMLNRDNGLVLLRIVALGNGYLQAVMERESNWMLVPEQQLNLLIQHAMTILMEILRLKRHIHEYDLSPLESAIYTQPKQRDTLRIIPMVTGYMSNIFNPRLPILSCRLLRRFAIEFRMSLLACLDMEPDQIRHTFLERLHDEIESEDLKLAVLEFVESCVHKQPGLTEAFFKVNYGKPDRRLLMGGGGGVGTQAGGKGRPKTMINDGIPTYMAEFLEAISKDPTKLASPLLSRIMSLFHALWKNNMQALVRNLLQKPNFWTSLCNPLFSEHIASNVRSYSQLFNILGIELFRVNSAAGVKMDSELFKIFERFTQNERIFARWVDIVVDIPDAASPMDSDSSGGHNVSVGGNALHSERDTPDWLGRLQSFKDLIVLIVRKKEPGISLPPRCETLLAERLLDVLVQRVEHLHDDLRPLIVLSELYLIVLSDFDHKYTEDTDKDDRMLKQLETLLSLLAVSYVEMHQRAKEALLAIAIKTIELQADRLLQNSTIAAEITRSAVDIAGEEIIILERAITQQAQGQPGGKPKPTPVGVDGTEGKQYSSLLLALNLLKRLIICFDQPDASGIETSPSNNRWTGWLVKGKLFQRVLSITGTVLPDYGRRKLAAELLHLLILLAESRCSEQLLYSDVGDYLWLKLLPPKELLQRPYVMTNENQPQWQTQDWWPIYSKGIHLVRALLEKHGYRFLRDAIFFVGIHEVYLMDSLMLAKQSLEPSAFMLIHETLELLCTMVRYEKEWRLEHSQSLLNLMRCTQFLMDHSISLLYRPKILKRLTTGAADNVGFIVSDLELDPSTIDTSDELVGAMNNLIEIVTLCAKCLLCFSPPLISLLCDVEFIPSQWCPLIEIQFGAPKLSTTDNYSQLSFGSLLQAVCIFTKVLNLQHYSFSETPLNELPAVEREEQDEATDGSLTMGLLSPGNRSALGESTARHGKRSQFSKTLSMTSVSSYTSTNAITISNELLTHLDSKRCLCGLEYVLTLLTSQSLYALKDTNLSQREKQLIKRELSTELLIFHDFVKKRVLKDAKCILSRKKHGAVAIVNEWTEPRPDHEDDDGSDQSSSSSDRSKAAHQGAKHSHHSMRINVVRKMHLQHQQQRTKEPATPPGVGSNVLSPIAGGQEFGRGASTPALRGILKPSPSASAKRVAFDDGLTEHTKSLAYVEPEDEPMFFEPQEPRFTGLSHVQMVEEDYIHLLSNVLLMIGQSEN